MKEIAVIAACVAAPVSAGAMAIPTDTEIANPASEFCKKMQGHTVIAKLPDGNEIGLCHLPENKIVEEWTLFRMLNGKKPTPRNNPFK